MTGTTNFVLPPILATMATRDPNGRAANALGATPQLGDIRRINLGSVLRTIQRQGPITRQELIASTGLSRLTVLELVSELQALGVAEEQIARHGANGRPAGRLVLDQTRLAVGAAEINLGEVAFRYATLSGAELGSKRIKFGGRRRGPAAVLNALAELIVEAMDWCAAEGRRLVHVTVGCLAIVAPRAGTIVKSFALGWGEVPIVANLRQRLGSDVAVSVDRLANVAIHAERSLGHWPHDAGIVMLYGDVGIGGSYQSHSDVLYGDSGLGGNFGHLTVEFDGRPCYCGRRGCLETYVGVGPLANVLDQTPDRPVTGLAVPREKTLSALRRDDPAVAEELRHQGRWLARGIEQVLVAFDPAVVILGGSLAEFAPLMMPSLEAEAARLNNQSNFASLAIVEPSKLGPDAVLRGGVVMSIDAVVREPWRLHAIN
jgi:predicted NBD/HSP70 family sugar kinase